MKNSTARTQNDATQSDSPSAKTPRERPHPSGEPVTDPPEGSRSPEELAELEELGFDKDFAGDEFEFELTERLDEYLARSNNPDEEWLWCIYCGRFFQAKFLRIDYLGNRQGCAFCKCAGFNVAIHQWDTFRHDNDSENWPKSVSELRHGLSIAPPGEQR